MELWLIRHGLPIRVDGGDGPADPPLAPEGRDQAERLGAWWGRHGVDAIYSSPLQRARETAAPLGEVTGCEVVIDAGLTEFDAHLSTYIPIEELRADEETWNRFIAEWTSPAAEEGRQQFRRDVIATIDAIAARHRGERVALVCHGGVINAYLSDVISLPGTIWFEPAYTSVSRSLGGDGRKQIVSVNETPHLPDLVLPALASKRS